MSTASGPPVIVRVEGHLGRLVLNRPAVINALDAEMVGLMRAALARWAGDESVRVVLISGEGDRGLCAGGDIRAIHADAASGGAGALRFWADEYRLNATVAAYPKPVVAWMDGLVMGGGIGISAHAAVRVVTERSRLAMPEVGIGFHPDAGGSWLLAHAPGRIGTHLALTGSAVGAADGILAGLADHFVPADRFDDMVKVLLNGDRVASLASAPPAGELAPARGWIDECYSAPTVAGILERLRAHPEPAARQAAELIAAKSPTALLVTLRSVRTAAGLPDLPAALEMEYRLSSRMLHLPDFAEGVRAQIIDKDRDPRWRPATLAEVPDSEVEAYFAEVRHRSPGRRPGRRR